MSEEVRKAIESAKNSLKYFEKTYGNDYDAEYWEWGNSGDVFSYATSRERALQANVLLDVVAHFEKEQP